MRAYARIAEIAAIRLLDSSLDGLPELIEAPFARFEEAERLDFGGQRNVHRIAL